MSFASSQRADFKTLFPNCPEAVRLQGIPRLDRFFPNCALGLIEMTARARMGVRDLKPCWFANTIEYAREPSLTLLPGARTELDVRVGVGTGPMKDAWTRLRNLYGLSVRRHDFATAEGMTQWIMSSLAHDLPALITIDQSFLAERSRWRGTYSPHMVAVVGVDPHTESLELVEQVYGRIRWPLADFIASFSSVSSNGANFALECVFSELRSNPKVSEQDIRQHLDSCLTNLRSPQDDLGLNGLRALVREASQAYSTFRRPFALPGLWIFSHDRHALKRSLHYWRLAAPRQMDLFVKLERTLSACFDHWLTADSRIEHSINHGVDEMSLALQALNDLVQLETVLCETLEELRDNLASQC